MAQYRGHETVVTRLRTARAEDDPSEAADARAGCIIVPQTAACRVAPLCSCGGHICSSPGEVDASQAQAISCGVFGVSAHVQQRHVLELRWKDV